MSESHKVPKSKRMKIGEYHKKRGRSSALFCLMLGLLYSFPTAANEVLPEIPAEIVVREHPQTGFSYVSIIDPSEPQSQLGGGLKKYRRPDYRMLDPKVKPRDVHYEGPSSDRKKVYILAGALAAGGLAGYAALPVAGASGGAATGAGAYAAASAAVTAGTFSTHWVMRRDDRPDDFTQVSMSREIPLE